MTKEEIKKELNKLNSKKKVIVNVPKIERTYTYRKHVSILSL